MAAIKGQPHICSECGVLGHNKTYHIEHKTKVCGDCRKELPVGDFRLVPETGRVKENRAYICIGCDKKRSFRRYRQDVHCRMGYLFAAARARAREKQWPFDITIQWLKDLYVYQQGKCFYSGLDLSLESGNYSISLDRRDPTKGYTQDNVVLACWMINNMKRAFTEQEFLNICETVLVHMKG